MKVKFIVGGKSFEVERSLLDQYPNSLLGHECATIDKDDPENGIIFDRDPVYFTHVLSFMTEGSKMELPTSVCKTTLREELEFYNIDYSTSEAFFEDCESAAASLIRGAECMQRIADFIGKKGNESIFKGQCMLLAQACIQEYEKKSFQGKKFELKISPDNFPCLKENPDNARVECNLHLKRVGLEIIKIQGKLYNREKKIIIAAISP